MKTIPIGEATEAQLRSFARDTLGIEIKATAKFETVRARVETAWNKPEILVDENEPEPKEATAKATPKPIEKGMVRLILGVTEEAGGKDPVPVGVNGKVMLIPRGIEVEIPYPYFEALSHAVTHVYDPLKDGGMELEPRKVPLYPFQRLDLNQPAAA